jgi:phenylalanyl-tRNA synthetase beta chain
MISEELMDIFELDKKKSYAITNPLSDQWVYMRPHLLPSVLTALSQNMNIRPHLQLFELSMTYQWKPGDLPDETPTLIVAWSGQEFYKAKGLAQALFQLFGIPFPRHTSKVEKYFLKDRTLSLGEYGVVGEIDTNLLQTLHIPNPVTVLQLDIRSLVTHAKSEKTYIPVPKFPPSFEDIALVISTQTPIGTLIEELKKTHHLIADITLFDTHKNTRTLHITFQSKVKNLTSEDIRPVRETLLTLAQEKFGAQLKM